MALRPEGSKNALILTSIAPGKWWILSRIAQSPITHS